MRTLQLVASLLLALLYAGIMSGCSGNNDAAIVAPKLQFRLVFWQNNTDLTSTGNPVVQPSIPFSIEVVDAGIATRRSVPHIFEVKFFRNGIEITPDQPATESAVRGGPLAYLLSLVGSYEAQVKYSVDGIDKKLIQAFNVTGGELASMHLALYNEKNERMTWQNAKGQYFSPIEEQITIKVEWYPTMPVGVKTQFTTSMVFDSRGAPTEEEPLTMTSISLARPGTITVTGRASDDAGFSYKDSATIQFDDGFGFTAGD